MANPVLDFVMSLVRDPEAAAHYAADPAQAIADANLTGVTSADVNQLIPVVTESLSSAVPTTGSDPFGASVAHNPWTSDAASAAFDAFGDHLPQQVVDDPHGAINDLVGAIDHPVVDTSLPTDVPSDVPTVAGLDDFQLDAAHVIDDAPVDPAVDAFDTAWSVASDATQHVADDHHPLPDDPGFDDLI